MSASRRQAYQFKNTIQKAAQAVDVDLKGGDRIILSNGAELHFLGTSAATAQSYTGNLYFDEFFWVSNFTNLRKVAAAMATLEGLTRTYFSTPSAETHEAYPFWTGERWNEKRPRAQRNAFDVSWKTLNSGLVCPDKTWRQIVIAKKLNCGYTDFMSYSIDFRRRILSIKKHEGLSIRETAKRFHIGTTTIVRWTKQIDARPATSRQRKIDKSALERDVEQYPDAYQRERAERFGVCQMAICKALKKLQLTYKKNSASSKSRRRR